MKLSTAEIKELESRGAVLGPTFGELLARSTPVWTGQASVFCRGLALKSEMNRSRQEHWISIKRRVDEQHTTVYLALVSEARPPKDVKLIVTICREFSGRGREFDSDNMQSAAKAARDTVAAWCGRSDDSAAGIEWRYEQKRSTRTGVGITITEQEKS